MPPSVPTQPPPLPACPPQYGNGQGGSGSALRHYQAVKAATGKRFPLVVKLGTITPHGADVYR